MSVHLSIDNVPIITVPEIFASKVGMMDGSKHAPARPPIVDYDSDSDSSSASDNATPTTSAAATPVEWLATGRAKRSTAGNRMKSMLANEEPDSDLELLFAEDEDDAGFTDVDDGGSDVHMDSDSDSEDEQNAAAGDDLTGEQELERQAKERRAAQRKRKANDAIPAKFRKKVRISEKPADSTAASSPAATVAPAPRPKKKSERTSWLPTTMDMPTRASARQTTVMSKEQLHNQMVEREAKRLKQVAAMERKAKKLEALKKPPMTQEQRLAEAALVEKRNAKSLNRWEEAEKAREEERAAKLAALNNRTLKGPVITFWSGMGEWEGDANGGKTVTMEEKQPRKKREKKEKPEKGKGKADKTGAVPDTAPDTPASGTSTAPPAGAFPENKPIVDSTLSTPATTSPNTPISTVDPDLAKVPEGTAPALKVEDAPSPAAPPAASELQTPAMALPTPLASAPAGSVPAAPPTDSRPRFMAPPVMPPSTPSPPPLAPIAPALQSGLKAPVLAPPVLAPPLGGIHLGSSSMSPRSNVLAPPNTTQRPSPLSLPPTTPGQLPSHTGQPPSQTGQPHLQPTPPDSQTQQPSLQPSAPASKLPPLQTQLHPQRGKPPAAQQLAPAPPTAEGTPASSALPTPSDVTAPQAAPPQRTTRHAIILQNFSEPLIANKSAQSRVLFGPHRHLAKLAKPPPAPLCAITNHPARYRDPQTGLPYFNAYAYREIQRLRKGEYRFSALVGAWVGSCSYAAKGVPVAFLGGPAAREREKEREKERERENLREAEEKNQREEEEKKQKEKQTETETEEETEKAQAGSDAGAVKKENSTAQSSGKTDADTAAPEPINQQQPVAGADSSVPQPSAPSAEAATPAAAANTPPPAEQVVPAPMAA
ncbi:hypothetical protein ACHAQH_008742 [Verticillium albo-atrum]